MHNNREIISKIREVVEPIIEDEGMELVDLQYRRENVGYVLRLFIDHEGGVTIDECALISKEVDKSIEKMNILQGSYTLEVSSPGLNRPLTKEADFRRFTGHLIKVRTYSPIDERKSFKGILLSCHDNLIEIEYENHTTQIPLDKIAKAHLEYEF
ncbi:MAG: ribosome maturation factor RimP [bacterium]